MTTTLDTFTRSGYLVYGTAPTVRRRVPGTRLWQVWTGTGWADSAPAAAPDTPTAPSAIVRRWVEPEIAPVAPRMPPAARSVVERTIRPYLADRLDMYCLHAHLGMWRLNSKNWPECAGCKRDTGQRYRARLAERADAG